MTFPKPELTYSKPDISSIGSESKPPAFSGKAYPLAELNHRDFELLIYSLYKQEINSKKIPYADIALMSGIRDKGQDCALYSGQEKRGVIQCKHSERNTPLGLKVCVEEIIKFVLYSFADDTLLPELDEFVYYFASSSGFDTKTDGYLRTFSKKIVKEKNLEVWTNNVIKKFGSIKVEYSEIKGKLIERLAGLNLKLINPNDIQDLIVSYHSVTADRFFEIRMVVDNKAVLELKKELDEIKRHIEPKAIVGDKILKEFSDASIFLAKYKSSFSLKSPVTITRAVTNDILQWIKNPLKDKEAPICIVKGSAGCGKSVILNNLYHSLCNDQIPTIAFKADEKNAETIDQLEEKIGLSIPLEDSIQILASRNEKVVVIIDQIDALSQTLSANRDNLSTYILIIEKLKRFPNVRIVVSVREYDLNYDPYLIPFRNYTGFNAGLLTIEEVTNVLKSLKVGDVSPNLVKLLSTPLHLELFCQVYNKKEPNFTLYSLYDLYTELWRLKISKKRNRDFKTRIENTLYQLASKIYERQGGLSYNSNLFDDDCIEYLITEGLLIGNQQEGVMFFHQTFYDYAFAKQFVESGKDVTGYLRENSQGLYVRSSLKIILAHLREHNPNSYKELVKYLIGKKDIRFHIKQLVLNYIGFLEDPTPLEKELVEKSILDTDNDIAFIDSINSNKWVRHLISNGRLQAYLKNVNTDKINAGFQLILRNIHTSNNEILEFLTTLPSYKQSDELILRLLYFIEDWNETAVKLFERVKGNELSDAHHFCHCLEKASKFDQDWSLNEFSGQMDKKIEGIGPGQSHLKIDHSEIELLKYFYKHFRDKTFSLCKSIIEQFIVRTEWKHNEGGLSRDGMFHFYTKTDERFGDENEFLSIFLKQVEGYARRSSSIFTDLITDYSKSNHTTLLRILIYGILADPKKYYQNGYELVVYIHSRNGLVFEGKLSYEVRVLIGQIFPLLGFKEKESILGMIMTIRNPYENEVYTHPTTGEKIRIKQTGRQQYMFLQSIPVSEIGLFSGVFKKYQELSRRFGKVEDNEPEVMSVFGSHPPYKKENYEKMSLDDWEKTFYKYHADYKPDFFTHRGGLTEHGRAFEEHVSKRPDFFYPLIDRIIGISTICDDYKTYGISGLVKANYDNDLVLKLIHKIIELPLSEWNTLYTIWKIDQLIRDNKITDKVFKFLVHQATFSPNPSKDDLDKPYQRSINTVRGAALDCLLKISDKKYANGIFKLLNTVYRSEKMFTVRANVVHNSAYLINLDPTKAFNIFRKYIVKNPKLVKEAMWAGGYFAYRFFNKMDFLILPAMKLKDEFKSLSNLLSKQYIRGNKKAGKYLFKLSRKSNDAKAEVVRVVTHPGNLIDKNQRLSATCVELFNQNLKIDSSEVVHQYSVAFLHFTPEMFESLFPILSTYSNSKVFRNSPAYFCKYITQCCNKSTVYKCLDLTSSFDKLVRTNITQGNYYSSEPLNVILGIYNVLGISEEDRELKEKCMDMFDSMLKQPQHRVAATKAVELADL